MNEAELLRKHPLAHGLSEAQLGKLLACARIVQFPAGAFVFRESDPADTVYLLSAGRVVLEQHVPGQGPVQVEDLSAGDLLGLSWLFPGGRWILDARAAEATLALTLEARCVQAMMDDDPVLGLAVAKHLLHQLYQRLERVRLQRLDVYAGGR